MPEKKKKKVPKLLERCVRQQLAKGHSKSEAFAICTKSLQKSGSLKKGKATAKGKRRGKMSPAARAKDRAVKYRGGKNSDYPYRRKSNTVRKKK